MARMPGTAGFTGGTAHGGVPPRRGRPPVSSTLRVTEAMRSGVTKHSAERMADQLARALSGGIEQQGLAAGSPLPGEYDLCEEFGVSRTVVRQALRQLERRGLVQRRKGKGTFVGDGKTGETFFTSLGGLHAEVAARGGTVTSEVLRLDWEPASAAVAKALDTGLGDQVIVLDRLRYVDGEPWCWATTWLRAGVWDAITGADLTTASLYGLLRDAGIELVSAHRTVEAVVASDELAARLQISGNPAVLVLTSVTFDAGQRPVEFFVARHRGDRSRFEFDVQSA